VRTGLGGNRLESSDRLIGLGERESALDQLVGDDTRTKVAICSRHFSPLGDDFDSERCDGGRFSLTVFF
jgi:hypothetical protein